MHRFPSLRRAIVLAATVAAAGASLHAAAVEKFSTTPTVSTEASLLIRLLDEAQYNHASVHQSDFGEIVPDYMMALDSQHLFFLGTDKAEFMKKYDAKTLYANLAYLGNVDPAYDMYYRYSSRVSDRVHWILTTLDKGLDFTGNDTFAADRSKADWPATAADADALWTKRLKFEVLQEMLDKKTPQQATAVVHKRYDGMLHRMGQTKAVDLSEIFLTTVAALYDPHSNYFSADTFEDFGIQMKLHFVGIGAVLQAKDDYCVVKEIVPGGPADVGHQLKPEDKIVSVRQDSGTPVEVMGMRLRDVVNLIRGNKDTHVTLTVERAGVDGHKAITITRDDVKLSAARAHGAVFQVPDGAGKTMAMGVISLPEFYNSTDDPNAAPADRISASEDVKRILTMMKADHISGVVLDLRGNGGGFLTEAINLAGLFIPQGPVVQVRDSMGEIKVDSDEDSSVAWDGPLAVLENRFSASASEIVAGALQNYGRAIIIGDTSTHGKGTVQTVLDMKQIDRALAFSNQRTGAAKITIQKFYLPNGSSTQLEGVKADIVLPSIDEFLPIGESSLPHALIWDRIPTSKFSGHALDPKLVDTLKEDSLRRQHTLEEFTYLQRNVDWFKQRQDDKEVSLNLAERQKQKLVDDAFRKEMQAERTKLAKEDYPFKEVRVAPAPPPPIKQAKSDDDSDDDTDALSTDADPDKPYVVDVEMKEALRVIQDAIYLGRNREYWASNHPPLTIASNTKS